MATSSPKPKPKLTNSQLWRYAGMGSTMLAIILIGTVSGIFLDKLTGFRFPLFIAAASLGAVFWSMYTIIRRL